MRTMEIVEKLQQTYDINPGAWDVVILVLAIAFVMHVLSRPRIGSWLPIRPRGRVKMLRRARRNFVRSMVIDKLVETIEGWVYDGTMTRAEAKEMYRDARKYWPVKDLFPSPELLKANIQKRLNSKTHTPVPLVGTEGKKKHMFSK